MQDATYESLIDRRVQARLATDRRYLNAENSEPQAIVELLITAEVELAWLRVGSRKTLPVTARLRELELEQCISELVDELVEAGAGL